jgi:integrase
MARQRREWGEGSVFEDKHGQWWARVSIGPGRYRRARVDTEQAGKRQVKAWIEERDAGTDLRAARMGLRVWVSRWLADLRDTQAVRPRTIEFYERHAGYALHYLGHVAIEAFTPEHWRETRRRLLADGLGRTSVNHVHTVLGTALERAVSDRALSVNPMRLVDKLPKTDDAFEARAISAAELDALRAACQPERLGIFFEFIADTGVRQGEARNLRWSDLNLDDERPHFRVAESKSKAGRRRVGITPAWAERLRALRVTQADERAVAGERWQEHLYVFPSEVGTQLTARAVQKIFKRILARAGLDLAIRIHDLRHTYITDLISSGVDPRTAQGIAGHSSPSVTMGIYAHYRDDEAGEAAEKVEKRRRGKA